jgi:hypothetical protein
MFTTKLARWPLVILVGLLVAACSGASATPATTSTPTPTPTITLAPTVTPTLGPATQSLTVTDSTGKALLVSNASIRCNMPSTSGLLINVIGQPGDPNLSVYIDILPTSVSVRYDSGSGSTYAERNFSGAGVTSFDPGKGAQIDTTLAEVAGGGNPGKLGVLASLKGSVDCGNQMPGSATLTFSGPTPKGDLSGGLLSANVECTSNTTYGSAVSALGLVLVGGTQALAVVYISPNTMSVALSTGSFFRNTATATATLTSNGATVSGDLVEQSPPAGTTAHTIHLEGAVICGTTLTT